MKISHRFLLFASLFLLLAESVVSQVVINEFCTANYSDWAPGGGTEFEDWVELYNPTGSAVNIGGYWLSNKVSNPQKWEFPASTNIPANSYLVVLLSGTGDYEPNFLGYQNTNFRVTQTGGDDLVFSNAGGTILESYEMDVIGAFQTNHSYARTTDGGAVWSIHTDPSQGVANSGATYTAYAQKPVLSIQAGYQSAPISVSITAEAGTTIYYTLDGSEPDNSDTPYTGPVAINSTKSLRAIAYSTNPAILPSLIETNTYFLGGDEHDILTVAISGGTLSDGAWGWGGDEFTHIEFFTPEGVFITEATGGSNEHGNDSNAYPQRGFDYITRDAMGYSNVIDYPVFASSNRPSYERLIFKAAANDNYPSSGGAHIRDAYVHKLSVIGGLNLDERDSESCVLYINGAYWGVYEAREKVDDIDFTKFYYDQPDGFVDFLKTWGGTWEEYGSGADWYDLVAFITGNDMTDQANYDYVLTQYDHMSLIDYFILNGYVVTTDWLNWNTAWWRGRYPSGGAKKWKYTLWDNDASFGHYVNYTGVPSQAPTADPCQIDEMGDVGGQGHVPVLNALFDNESFFGDYIQRYATLSNTLFSCERMNAILDSMIQDIDPEMTRHCTRWGGTYNEWQANVQTLRDFIDARCSSEIIGGIEDCYDVTAFNLTVELDGTGDIELATLYLNNANTPFTGTYFSDVPITLDALTSEIGCGAFEGWEITSGTGVIADPASPQTTMIISSDVTIVAHFGDASGGPVVLTSDMSVPGAGTILVNGTPQPTYDFELTQDPGVPTTYEATENEWFTFNHWETLHSVISPNNQNLTITITPCQSDTIIAVYDVIDHFILDINVGMDGGGTVLMNGNTIDEGGVTLDLLGGEFYSFTAIPADEWSSFGYWVIDGNIVSPDEFSESIMLELIESGSITAVFTITPHHTVTVMVEPMYSGVVTFEEEHITGASFSTDSYVTVELEGMKPLGFTAKPDDFWHFTEWTSKYSVANPNENEADLIFTVIQNDTIVAHFEKEPFTMYIPNSFSPNDDGINDYFHAVGNAIDPTSFHLMIFNRWGEKVFETFDKDKVWEGDFQNGDYYVRDAVYEYILKVKSVHETDPKTFKGSIMVVR